MALAWGLAGANPTLISLILFESGLLVFTAKERVYINRQRCYHHQVLQLPVVRVDKALALRSQERVGFPGKRQ